MKLEADRYDIFSTSPYLLVKFTPGSYQPIFSFLHKPRVFINDTLETQIRSIETAEMDLDTSIMGIYIDIISEESSEKEF